MEIYIRESEMPNRCDSCPFCYKRDNKDGTATIDYVCLAKENTRSAMANLHYTDTMYWKHENCPLKSLEQHDKEVREQVGKEYLDATYKQIFDEKRREYVFTDGNNKVGFSVEQMMFLSNYAKSLNEIRNQAIKEFAERLKNIASEDCETNYHCELVLKHERIDELVEEMTK